jgi:hypothetical protein
MATGYRSNEPVTELCPQVYRNFILDRYPYDKERNMKQPMESFGRLEETL